MKAKRIFSLLLAVAMIISLIPAMAASAAPAFTPAAPKVTTVKTADGGVDVTVAIDHSGESSANEYWYTVYYLFSSSEIPEEYVEDYVKYDYDNYVDIEPGDEDSFTRNYKKSGYLYTIVFVTAYDKSTEEQVFGGYGEMNKAGKKIESTFKFAEKPIVSTSKKADGGVSVELKVDTSAENPDYNYNNYYLCTAFSERKLTDKNEILELIEHSDEYKRISDPAEDSLTRTYKKSGYLYSAVYTNIYDEDGNYIDSGYGEAATTEIKSTYKQVAAPKMTSAPCANGSVDVTFEITPFPEYTGEYYGEMTAVAYLVSPTKLSTDEIYEALNHSSGTKSVEIGEGETKVTVNIKKSGYVYAIAARAILDDDYNLLDSDESLYTATPLKVTSEYKLPCMTEAGTGARTAVDDAGNIYLGGNFIEVGIAKHGGFGTYGGQVPDNFHTEWFLENTPNAASDHGDSLGLVADGDGWNTGDDPIAGDFFVPGTPYEAWEFAYTIDGSFKYTTIKDLDNGGYIGGNLGWSEEPVTVLPKEGELKAVTTGVTSDGVKIILTHTLAEDDLFFLTDVEIENNSGKEISNVYYSRNFDPDQDQWFTGSYSTWNKVFATPDRTQPGSENNFALVVARGEYTGAGFFYISFDPRATTLNNAWGVIAGNTPADLDYKIAANTVSDHKYDKTKDSDNVDELGSLGYNLDDTGIGIICKFSPIADGKKDKFEYVMSLDPDVSSSIARVIDKVARKKVNPEAIEIYETDPEESFALFDSEGEKIAGWFKGGEDIVFEGLEPEATYTLKKVPTEYMKEDMSGPKEDTPVEKIVEETIITPIDIDIPDDEAESEKPTVSFDAKELKVKNLRTNYTYALTDIGGEVLEDNIKPDKKGDITLPFKSLDPSKTYKVIARKPGHPEIPSTSIDFSLSDFEFTVTFDCGVAPQTVRYGKKVQKPEDPEDGDKAFEGWFTDKAYTTLWDFDSNVVLGDTDLYGKFEGKKPASSGGGSALVAFGEDTKKKEEEKEPEEKEPEIVEPPVAPEKTVADPTETGVAALLETVDHIKYMNGYPEGDFRPLNNMTRAEAAQMFYNLLINKDVEITASFADVPEDAWFAKAVNTLASMNILNGKGDNKFDPNGNITRAEFTAIAMRFTSGVAKGTAKFIDVPVTHWAAQNISDAAGLGWIDGVGGGKFAPDDKIQRAAVAKIVNNMLFRRGDREFIDSHSEIKKFPDVAGSAWYYEDVMEATDAHDYERADGVESWK